MFANKNLLSHLTCLLLCSIATIFQLQAQTRLGLHVTQEELAIWRQRAANGPYQTKGDVSENSPGDWDRIVNRAESFLENPDEELYKGYTGKGCVPHDSKEPQNIAEKIRDAAFVYLITNNTKYSTAVRKALLAQAAEPSTDFSNRSLWCADFLRDRNPAFFYAVWMSRLLFAYDYIKRTVPAAEKQILDQWFYNAALYFQSNVDNDLSKIWVNRKVGDYTLSGYAKVTKIDKAKYLTHTDGYKIPRLALWYNNRRSAMIFFVTLAGIHLNNKDFKNSGKLFVKEWLKYSTFKDGTIGEFERWSNKSPEQGWQYAMIITDFCIGIADHLARTGDNELYTYSTSAGKFGTEGGNKSLELVASNMLKYVNRSHNRYATSNPKNKKNNAYRIDGISPKENKHYVFDTWVSQANIYFKNSFLKQVYLRKTNGTSNYPDYPTRSGSYIAWTGAFGIYPGKLFMFGQMEGKVWPYSSASTSKETGSLTIEYWKGDKDKTTKNAVSPSAKPTVTSLTAFEIPSHIGDHYNTRVRGYVQPPVNGRYTFWLAGDDDCELWLSTDDNPKNKRKIAYIDGWTRTYQWNKYDSQKSASISLQAGKKYYVEVLHKEREGEDHMAVGWQLPDDSYERPIRGSRLSPFVIHEDARIQAVEKPAEVQLPIQVYPNPFTDHITIQTGNLQQGTVAITIVDMLGKVCHERTVAMAEEESEIYIDLSKENLKPGIYILQVVSEKTGKKLIKIIKS